MMESILMTELFKSASLRCWAPAGYEYSREIVLCHV